MSKPLHEERLASEQVFDGKMLKVYRDEVRTPDGSRGVREYVRHPGAVLVVPLLADGRVVLERQYRYPLDRVFIELPAGKIDPGEDPLVTGQRELLEETGYTAGRWDLLGTINNAIGYSDERILLYLAQDLTPGRSRLDEGELLEVFDAPLDDLLQWIRRGEVTDVKTIIAAYWADEWLRGVRPASGR
jgi:ADP-ribose pyrophosphatase